MIWDIALAVMAVIAFTFIGIPLIIGALCLILCMISFLVIKPFFDLACFIRNKNFKKDNVPDNDVGNKEESDHA